MAQNPSHLEYLANEHIDQLRRDAARAGTARQYGRPERRRTGVRRAAGWLLVDVGLRLAADRDSRVHGVVVSRRSATIHS